MTLYLGSVEHRRAEKPLWPEVLEALALVEPQVCRVILLTQDPLEFEESSLDFKGQRIT